MACSVANASGLGVRSLRHAPSSAAAASGASTSASASDGFYAPPPTPALVETGAPEVALERADTVEGLSRDELSEVAAEVAAAVRM